MASSHVWNVDAQKGGLARGQGGSERTARVRATIQRRDGLEEGHRWTAVAGRERREEAAASAREVVHGRHPQKFRQRKVVEKALYWDNCSIARDRIAEKVMKVKPV